MTRPRPIPAGARFGKLTVTVPRGLGDPRVQCRCDCGARLSVRLTSWGRTRSCGCARRDANRARCTTHGHSGEALYMTWVDLVGRCTRPTHKSYADYGGRGIRVCERWRSFEKFLADVGERPAGLSLDRIDNDGNYEPGNVRWTTKSVQNRNRRACAYAGNHRDPLTGRFLPKDEVAA